jgi:hypothetical protein
MDFKKNIIPVCVLCAGLNGVSVIHDCVYKCHDDDMVEVNYVSPGPTNTSVAVMSGAVSSVFTGL